MIATIATHPMLADDGKQTLLGVLLIILIHWIFTKLSLHKATKRFLVGDPSILVKHGKIVKRNLRRSDISLIELLAHIRSKGYPDLRDIQYAILEPTGDLTVLPKDELYPVTPEVLNLPANKRDIALSLVVDGQIQARNLQFIGKDVHWLKEQLQKKGFQDIGKVFYAATMEHRDDLFVDDGKGYQA
ncbi:DUF421 domain-containing protein [Paludifilum halophilum]|nr:DUF421 domain-containing protein [Paludifilum halophilum]